MQIHVYENTQNGPILSQIHKNTGIKVRKSPDVLGLCVVISGYSINFYDSIFIIIF